MFLGFFDKKNSQSNERMFRYAVLAGAVMRCRLLGRADLAAVSVAGWQATWEEMGFCGAPLWVCTTKRGHMEYQWISLMRFSLTIVFKWNTVVYPEIWQWVSRWLWTSLVAYGGNIFQIELKPLTGQLGFLMQTCISWVSMDLRQHFFIT